MVEQSFIEVGDGLNDIIEELEEDEDGTIEPRQIELLRVSVGEAMHWLSELYSDLIPLLSDWEERAVGIHERAEIGQASG